MKMVGSKKYEFILGLTIRDRNSTVRLKMREGLWKKIGEATNLIFVYMLFGYF